MTPVHHAYISMVNAMIFAAIIYRFTSEGVQDTRERNLRLHSGMAKAVYGYEVASWNLCAVNTTVAISLFSLLNSDNLTALQLSFLVLSLIAFTATRFYRQVEVEVVRMSD